MLRSEAISIIKRGLGFRQTQDTAIIAALKAAQRDLEAGKTLPSWLLTFDAPLVVAGGTNTLALPADFLRMHDDYDLYYFDSDNPNVPISIPRQTYSDAVATFAGTEGPPRAMVMRTPESAILIPPPTTDLTVYLTYYHAAAVLDSEVENEWLANAANYIIGIAGMSMAGDLRDAGALQRFTQMAKLGGQGYMGEVIEQELAGRPLIMGRNN